MTKNCLIAHLVAIAVIAIVSVGPAVKLSIDLKHMNFQCFDRFYGAKRIQHAYVCLRSAGNVRIGKEKTRSNFSEWHLRKTSNGAPGLQNEERPSAIQIINMTSDVYFIPTNRYCLLESVVVGVIKSMTSIGPRKPVAER